MAAWRSGAAAPVLTNRAGWIALTSRRQSWNARLPRCDALFQRGAWRAEQDVDTWPSKVQRPPSGWQQYCAHLWEHHAGEIRLHAPSGSTYRILHGDLLDHLVNAQGVVNSANLGLVGPARPEYWMFATHAGSSVEESLHKAAGPELLESCKALPFREGNEGVRCRVGEAVVTRGTASLLPGGYVIHVVAPRWHAMETSSPGLKAAWCSALDLAMDLGINTIAAPALGCGAKQAPLEAAANIWAHALLELESHSGRRHFEVRIVLNSFESWKAWTNAAYSVKSAWPTTLSSQVASTL